MLHDRGRGQERTKSSRQPAPAFATSALNPIHRPCRALGKIFDRWTI